MPPTKGVQVKLDRLRTLRYTNRALVALEEQTGQTLAETGERAAAGSLRAVSALVWAGLLHAEPDLQLDAAIDRLDLSRLAEISEATGKALEAAFGPTTNGTAPGKAPPVS